MASAKNRKGKDAIELIEEAVHLLRLAPVSVLASYYIGSLPLVLAFLFYWADMSRSALAPARCVAASFGLALLFLWMKCWQAVFAHQLRVQVGAETARTWTGRRVARLAAQQTIAQPIGLFVLPFALLLTLPFGWAYACFQNLTTQSIDESSAVKPMLASAWRQARLWPLQNHAVLALLFLFGMFVFLNLASVLYFGPALVKMFLGVETLFTQSLDSVLNTTFCATVTGLTYLCVDPLVKAIYVLRCFHGESLQSGKDLKAELKSFTSADHLPKAALILILIAASLPSITAAESETADRTSRTTLPPSTINRQPSSVSPSSLDVSITTILERREFSWRLPRASRQSDSADEGLLALFFEQIVETLNSWAKAALNWGKKIVDWLRNAFSKPPGTQQAGEFLWWSWLTSLHGMVFLLLVVAVGLLTFLLYRLWLRRRPPPAGELPATAGAPTPELTEEHIAADQLPEDGWLNLARELMARGELRLALRALYLASLAHLAQRGLITIAKFKSNRDYERELRRRAHAVPDVLATFAQNLTVFDRIWYGRYEVTAEILQSFFANVEKLRAKQGTELP